MVAQAEAEADPRPGAPETHDDEGVDWRRWLIRVFVAAIFVFALAVALRTEAPEPLPGVALGAEVVYRLELIVAVFFAGLLIATPLVQGVINGRLADEITMRGAKFRAEDVEQSLAGVEKRLKDVEYNTHQALTRVIQHEAVLASSAVSGTPPPPAGD